MCTHGRFVVNRYTGQQFFAKCGHCKACKQEKAIARSNRIRHEYHPDLDVFFGELDYDRMSVPYIRWDEVKSESGTLNIYRQFDIKWNVNKCKYVKTYKRVILDTIYPDDYSDIGRLKFLQKGYGRIGVCYFKDIQLFYKRFRINLKRDYGISFPLKMFSCVELGGKTQRPHFHFLLFFPRGYAEELRLTFCKSWPFSDRTKRPKSFQLVTDDPASYVSSYVNCGSNVSTFHERYFKSKHSHSKYFGHNLESFTLASVLSKIDKGDISYLVEQSPKGCGQNVSIPIPKYVLNRYFPIFKGYSKLTNVQVYDYISSNFEYDKLYWFGKQYDWSHPKYQIDYTKDDLMAITVRMRHAYEYFIKYNPDKNIYDYADYYCRCWNSYKSLCYRRLVEDDAVHPIYKYDNLVLIDDETYNSFIDTLSLLPDANLILDPNEFPERVNKTLLLEQMYDKLTKQKEVTAIVRFENDPMC